MNHKMAKRRDRTGARSWSLNLYAIAVSIYKVQMSMRMPHAALYDVNPKKNAEAAKPAS